MKAVVAAFNQEKALVGTFSVLTNLRMELFQALVSRLTGHSSVSPGPMSGEDCGHVTRAPPMGGGVRVTSLSAPGPYSGHAPDRG